MERARSRPAAVGVPLSPERGGAGACARKIPNSTRTGSFHDGPEDDLNNNELFKS
jgi:hypothetical protein